MGRFEGKVAVVTGGAQGIGLEIVSGLVKEGARVVVADLEAGTLQAACDGFDPSIVTGVVCDVSRKASVDDMVWKVMERHGRIDLLFNNAGICRYGLFLEETEANWDANFAVDAKGTFLVGQAVAREMVKQGHGGAIVNTASLGAEIVFTKTAAYGAAKAAVVQLTKVMALELARYGIRVNAFGPGPTATRMTAQTRSEACRSEMILKRTVAHRFGEPEECAAVALFLASDEASFVNGAFYLVDGGFSIQ